MKIQKHTLFFLSLFLLFCLFCIPKISNAATTDCVQTSSDGQSPCIQATNYWNGDGIAGKFPTYEQYRDYYVNTVCTPWLSIGGCGEKTVNGIIDGRTCGDTNYCNEVSSKNPNNKSGVATIYYYTNAQPNVYHVNHSNMQNNFICSNGYSAIYPDPNYGAALCKPSNTTSAVDLSTPNPGCASCQSKSSSSSQQLQGSTTIGDPVSIGTGNKYVIENDYSYKSYIPLSFTRIYNSKSGQWSHNWNYSLSYLETSTLGKTVSVSLPNGSSWTYLLDTSNNWNKVNSVDMNKLIYNGSNEFTYILEDNSKITFKLQNGLSLSNDNHWLATNINTIGGFDYSLSYDTNLLLNKVSTLVSNITINQSTTQTSCNNAAVITSIVDQNNLTTTYTYTSCLLTKVTYPDNSFKTYEYSGRQLTTIKDEIGNIVQQTHYISSSNRPGYLVDQDGNSSNFTINKTSLSYGATSTTITDALSNSSIITLLNQNGQYKPTSYSTLCTFCDGVQGSSLSYNPNGYISSITDYKGNITQLSYDNNRNLLTQIKESTNNLPLQRQVDIAYHPVWNLATTITSPSSININGSYNNNILNNTYDSLTGRLLQKTITAPNDNFSSNTTTRTWNYIYNNLGQLIEIQNPMFVTTNDKTTYTYNNNGQINSIKNGLNQITTFDNYDNYGNPQQIISPDGTSLNLLYNLRGKIMSITKNNIHSTSSYTTNFTRNSAQMISRITSTSGAYQNFIYDTSQRLSSIEQYGEDNAYLGKTIFTLDNMSNITKIQILDASGTEIRISTKQYNSKNLLFKDLTSLNYATTYTYDANGNISNINDPNNKNISYVYDSLNRLSTQTNPDNGIETYNYNPDDSISSFIDPLNLTTSYLYNGFGEIIKITSPDTGVTSILRNLAGDITSKTDSKNITKNYTYDVLHRPLTIQTNNAAENITLSYDTCLNGTGKICSITDVSGMITYSYDDFGKLSSKTYTNESFIKTISYSYDLYGRLNKTTYPTGLELNYSYYNNKPISINYSYNGTTGTIISNGIYDPFDNRIKSYNYGNSSNYSKTFNKDGLISNINTSLSSLNQNYTFDSRLNINGMTGNTSATVTYDENSRLTVFNNDSYTYNKNGSRTSMNKNSLLTSYSNSTTSNQLNALSGGVSNLFTYDNIGNQITSTNKTFSYNDSGALIGYTDSSNDYSYLVNSIAQRTSKIDNHNSSNNIWFIYDENGNTISEYNNSNTVLNEYIYLNGTPVALFKNGTLYNIYSDHLGTPRTVADQSNNIVWQWNNKDPSGSNLPPIQLIEFNLRLPGQYFDKESNLHYNYFRTYDPTIGKYIQSDPLGISVENNTYNYVDSNSLNGVDPLGLLTNIWFVIDNRIREYNHTAIEINGNVYSFYPTKGKMIETIIGSKGIVREDKLKDFFNNYKYEKSITFKNFELDLDSEQEANLLKYLLTQKQANLKYSILNLQCTTFAQRAIQNIGVDLGLGSEFLVPHNLEKALTDSPMIVR